VCGFLLQTKLYLLWQKSEGPSQIRAKKSVLTVTTYMILRVLNDGSKENLYPEKDNELPKSYDSLEEATKHAKELEYWFGEKMEVATMKEALKYPIPKRW